MEQQLPIEETPLVIMGTAELAEYLEGVTLQKWDSKKVAKYVSRAREREFPPHLFPEPDLELRCGSLWTQETVDEYLNKKKPLLQ